MVVLSEKDESPLMGDVSPGQALTTLITNLFIAPVSQHKPQSNDFLLVRPAAPHQSAFSDPNKPKSAPKPRVFDWVVREIPSLYVVGQTQPKIEVPAPNSRSAQQIWKNRIQLFIYKLFEVRGMNSDRLQEGTNNGMCGMC